MTLLKFQELQEKFELKNPQRKVHVIPYLKVDDTIVMRSNDSIDILNSFTPSFKIGECFEKNNTIFCCLGSIEKNQELKKTNFSKSAKMLSSVLEKYNNSEITFDSSDFSEDLIYSLIISSYNYDFLKSQRKSFKYFLNAPEYQKIIKVAHSQNIARFLGDTPSNFMTPTLFVEYSKLIFKDLNVKIEVFDKKYMQEQNMNVLLSVSQGSVEEPKLLKISYFPRNSTDLDIGVVGKGVCFDSGGISIKPSANMCEMKGDMLGAATLLCAIKATVELNLQINLMGIFPLVENMPSGSATKPGDVFRSMKGLTVEVDNTDAEGRLILADALTFCQLYSPKYLIDAATLTGAMVVALGNVYNGFFTDDSSLSDLIMDVSEKTKDYMWRMPLSPYYKDSLKSQTADLNNMGGKGAGACKAAAFLKEFVDFDKTKWAHFDIAGTMSGSYDTDLHGSYSTGRPVPAFVELFTRIYEKLHR